MPDYTKYCCPVCNGQFEDNDDIVTCPECGTPHHRECYNITGHCVNQGLHEVDYSFLDEQKDNESIVANAKKERMKAMLDADEAEEEARLNAPPVIFPESKYDKAEEKIDDFSIGDIAATIRTNQERFIRIFRRQSERGSKIGWSWGAFFFGSLYMLFRKMYKQGIALLSIMVSIILLFNTLIAQYAPKYLEAIKGIAEAYSEGSIKTTQEVMAVSERITSASDYSKASMITAGLYAAIIVIRILSAMFSDYFYKRTVYDIIGRVTEHLKNGASFSQTPMLTPNGTELSQAQMKRLYLSNKGGITLFSPLIAITAIQLLMQLIA